MSESPTVAEALAYGGQDWLCIDCQHGVMGVDTLAQVLRATTATKTKRIVRVGGPTDRFGIQNALDLGADGVMVPLINNAEEARMAVSYCLFPPEGLRSIAYPLRCVYPEGVGTQAFASYLKGANKKVEVWLQVETKECLDDLDSVLEVPGITCAFLGPADMSMSLGLVAANDHNLSAALTCPDMVRVYQQVLEACEAHGVTPGVFCQGQARASQFADQGYKNIAYDADINIIINYTTFTMSALRSQK